MFEKKYIFRLNEKLTRDEVLETVGNKFYHDGIVTTGFVKAIQQREKDFPTGMILEKGTNIAISHTDDKYVNACLYRRQEYSLMFRPPLRQRQSR